MKVFISGPMSGYDNYNFPAFYAAEEKFKAQGYEVVNPARLFENVEVIPSWEECMRITLRGLIECSAIHILDGWEFSRGASIEVSLASQLGYKVV